MLLVPFGGSLWGPFVARDGGPGRPKVFFFSHLGSVWVILWFQVGSGAALGWYLDLFFGYLEMSFVDDFEKVLVFVRCVNSILTPVFLLPCYRYGRWH